MKLATPLHKVFASRQFNANMFDDAVKEAIFLLEKDKFHRWLATGERSPAVCWFLEEEELWKAQDREDAARRAQTVVAAPAEPLSLSAALMTSPSVGHAGSAEGALGGADSLTPETMA
jgi:hypothetical protein